LAISKGLDVDGRTFLLLYGILFVLALVAAVCLRMILRQPDTGPSHVELDPCEVAFLAGGDRRAVETAIVNLIQEGALELRQETKYASGKSSGAGAGPYRLVASGPLPPEASQLERAMHKAAAEPGETVRKVASAVLPAAKTIRERLVQQGLFEAGPRALAARFLPTIPLLGLLAVGCTRIAIGADRDRPVGFLVAACILTFLVIVRFWSSIHRSRFGARILKQYKLQHAKLKAAARSSAKPLATGDVAMALFGVVALSGGPWAELHQAIAPPSHGGTGCGGGCSSGDGGGDGGGGCGSGGGCGGCGGCGCGG
jgi:uncharacterized protein (TIGR04222 family)